MKVCFFANSLFAVGGEQRMTGLIANYLIANGYKVTIIIKHRENVDYDKYGLSRNIDIIFLNNKYDFRLNNIKFFEILRIVNRKMGVFKNSRAIVRRFFCSNSMLEQLKIIFAANDFDFVIGVAGDRSFILAYLRSYIKGKLIFWNHQAVEAHFRNKGSRYYNEEIFIQSLMTKFDEIVMLNNYDKRLIDQFYEVKARVIPNCKSFVSYGKSKLNSSKFLAIGRLTSQKGFDLLIKAMNIFAKTDDKYTLDIVGEGPHEKYLQCLINRYNLSDRIKICKNTSGIKELYLDYDAFLMSSRYEGFGLVTLEAMECGLPVIAFDIPANRELIIDSQNGVLIDCFDVDKFAKAMVFFANSLDLRKEFADNSYLSTDRFSENLTLSKWLEILK